MIYSKTERIHHIKFNSKKIKNLLDWTPSPNDIFYHHFYDDLLNGIKINDSIDDKHWEHLKQNKKSMLMHENCGETFNYNFINEIVELLKLRQIDPSQLYILVMDEVHKTFLINGLKINNVVGVNVEVYNHLLKNVQLDNNLIESKKKFSSLSRNYRSWRLQLFYHLLKNNLLKDFNYSFYNIHPYEKKSFSVVTMMDDLKKASLPITDNFLNWLYDVPYKIDETDNVYNKWADITYVAICSSDIHITIETHFDPFLNNNNDSYDRQFAPSSITEKTYKPMACKKPFIMFSTPYFLEDLKSMGYKTFSDLINEDYDLEIDNKKRLDLIIIEIQKILSMDNDAYLEFINKTKEICEFNYNHLMKQKNEKIPALLRELVDAR
jgi:hypothetical protein